MDTNKRITMLEERIANLENKLSQLDGKKCDKNISSVLASYDFSDEYCRKNSGWKVYNAEAVESDDGLSFRAMQVEKTLGVFCDPMLINNNVNLPADKIKKVHVRIKSNVDATQRCMLRVYFTTDRYNRWSQPKSVDSCYPAGRLVDVYVDTKNRYWNGIITCIRIDPVEGLKGSIEIELVEFLDEFDNVVYSMDFAHQKSLEDSGWMLKNTSFVHCDGRLTFNVDVLEKKRIFVDPFIKIENLDIDASMAKYIHIKMRVDVKEKPEDDTYMQILFKTKSSNIWNQDKSIRFRYNIGEDVDAYIEVKQLFWKGKIVALRIDPFEVFEGRAEIRLLELLSEIPGGTSLDMLEARTKSLEDRLRTIL